MQCIGLDRANLTRRNPRYMIAVAGLRGKIIFSASDISRTQLEKIINLKELKDPAVFSELQFDMIKNLTDRQIIIYSSYMQDYVCYHEPNRRILTPYYFLRVRQNRCRMTGRRFDPPELEHVRDDRGILNLRYSFLIWSTKLMSIAADGA